MPRSEPPYFIEGGQVTRAVNILGGGIGGTVTVRSGADVRNEGFATGTSGWIIKADGTVEFESGAFRGDITGATGTFAGSLIGGELHIPVNQPGAGLHVDSSGNMWWGAFASFVLASIKIGVDGAAAFSNITITGGSVAGSTVGSGISGTNVTTGALNADLITTGGMNAARINAGLIAAARLTADNINTGTMSADRVTAGTLTAVTITASTLQSGTGIHVRITGSAAEFYSATNTLRARMVVSGSTLTIGKVSNALSISIDCDQITLKSNVGDCVVDLGNSGYSFGVSDNAATPPASRGMAVNHTFASELYRRATGSTDGILVLYSDNGTTKDLQWIVYGNGDTLSDTGVYGTLSDKRLKRNIRDLSDSSATLRGFRPRTFSRIGQYREDGTVKKFSRVKRGVGHVAQEAQVADPGLVGVGMGGGLYMKTSLMIPRLHGGWLDHDDRITALEKREAARV